MKRLLLLASLLLAFEVGAFAQMLPPDVSMPENMHTAANVPVIDGSKNPELIPDGTAYRLVFVVAADSASPTPDEVVQHGVYLGKLALNRSDRVLLATTLKSFKEQYDDLVKNYNDAMQVAIANGESPDIDAFLIQREALVQSTRDKLKLLLTNEGLSRLDAFVRGEKRSMKTQTATP